MKRPSSCKLVFCFVVWSNGSQPTLLLHHIIAPATAPNPSTLQKKYFPLTYLHKNQYQKKVDDMGWDFTAYFYDRKTNTIVSEVDHTSVEQEQDRNRAYLEILLEEEE